MQDYYLRREGFRKIIMKKTIKTEKKKVVKIEEVKSEVFEFTKEEVLFIAKIFGPFTEAKLKAHLDQRNAAKEKGILFKMYNEIFKALDCKL